MKGFLFYRKPVLCCRCGEAFSEGQHVFRIDPEEDELMCSGCSYTSENEYIIIDGEPKASTEYSDEDNFEEGYYEIRKADGLYIIERFRHLNNELDNFISENRRDSFTLFYEDEKASVYLPESSVSSGLYNIEEVKKWADTIFYDFKVSVVTDEYLRVIKRKAVKNYFTREDAKEFFEYCRKRIIGQDKQLKKAVYMVIEYVENVMSSRFDNVRNWMLTAPSGSGKTEFYRAVRDYFKLKKIDIPVLLYDLSNITPAGYNGGNVDDLVKTLKYEASDGKCIFFLDESDKKFITDITSTGTDFSAASQSALLSLVEGRDCGKYRIGEKTVSLDTSRTMFVFLGAFQYIRDDRVRKRSRKNQIGFGSPEEAAENKEKENAVYEDIKIEDMIKYGLTEQLAGRISQVINFRRIPEEDMKMLIRKKVSEISDTKQIKINITDSAVNEFLNISYTPLGVRAVINRINELVSDVITESFFAEEISLWNEIDIVSADEAKLSFPELIDVFSIS